MHRCIRRLARHVRDLIREAVRSAIPRRRCVFVRPAHRHHHTAMRRIHGARERHTRCSAARHTRQRDPRPAVVRQDAGIVHALPSH